ncbi:MAG: ABC transporter ATP-binding protein [Crocinitomicaceae bacterium]|nr:ABC transporter ATP-binding protein/permease [Crocinitomicaceae bacterium]MDC0100457.1 ABC transporter ATP-binding protein/permease [Crocinitomicaceae bacterium]|tara:strand:+ start:1401 stop:3224 length:1824 start_codon:yes stop_codon:yes gene_type:complete
MLRPKKKEKEKRVKLSKDDMKRAKKIFSYLRPYAGIYVVGWLFLALSSLVGLLFPLLMGQLLGTGSDQDSAMSGLLGQISITDVDSVAMGLLIVFAAQAIFGFFRIIIFTHVTESALRDIKRESFSRLLYMPMDFFNKNKVGELTSRMSADVEKIQQVMGTTIAEFFRQIIIIVGGIIFLLFLSWKLALIMLGTFPVMIIIAVIFGRFIRKLSKEAQDEAAKSNSTIEESLMGISNVKSFTRELFMLGKYKTAIDNIKALNVKSGLWRGVFASFIIFCIFGAIVFVIWKGLLMTQGPNPELAQKDFFSFIMFTIMMGASFGSIADMYANIMKAVGASEHLMDIIGTKNEKDLLTGKEKPAITGEVNFESVSFSYPQRDDIEILKSISFSAKKNQTIALVGPSGAGKSTVASLLLNYYPITGGKISFDGKSSENIDIEHLRSHMALVPQDVILFAGSIKENIAFGKPDATEDEIIDAAKKANAWEFINSFPDNLETEVGDRGIQLSGGQKQRVAIARAILKDPAILILDEATSALDSESERLVQEALDTLMKGRTSFVIAHRLSTIKKADKILVLENGEIKEQGIHDDLIAQKGIYSHLVSLQGVEAS